MKNWTVVSEPVRGEHAGLCSYLNYLIAENHKNHINKTRIVTIHNSVNGFINNCIEQITERNLVRTKNKKGGRNISSYAQSFMFSLPADISLFDHQWKSIAKHIFKDLSDYLNIDHKVLLDHAFINLHDEDKQHINLVVSKVINGNVIRDIQRKSVIKMLKHSFNAAVLKYTQNDYQDYIPETKRSKRYKKHYYIQNKQIINALHKNNSPQYDFLVPEIFEQANTLENKRTRRFE